ncbi:hypothetical protein ACOSQ2_021264 [Xanthoceras sorbifolium]
MLFVDFFETPLLTGSIESEIQACIDGESTKNLMKALQDPFNSEEELVKLLTQFEDRVLQGFNRHETGSSSCAVMAGKSCREPSTGTSSMWVARHVSLPSLVTSFSLLQRQLCAGLLELDFKPFNASFPRPTLSKSIGNGVEFLNRHLSRIFPTCIYV